MLFYKASQRWPFIVILDAYSALGKAFSSFINQVGCHDISGQVILMDK